MQKVSDPRCSHFVSPLPITNDQSLTSYLHQIPLNTLHSYHNISVVECLLFMSKVTVNAIAASNICCICSTCYLLQIQDYDFFSIQSINFIAVLHFTTAKTLVLRTVEVCSLGSYSYYEKVSYNGTGKKKDQPMYQIPHK